jgi:serine protease Do
MRGKSVGPDDVPCREEKRVYRGGRQMCGAKASAPAQYTVIFVVIYGLCPILIRLVSIQTANCPSDPVPFSCCPRPQGKVVRGKLSLKKKEVAMNRWSKIKQSKLNVLFFVLFAGLLTNLTAISVAGAEQGQEGPRPFAALVKEVKHAVVNISTTQVVKARPMQPFFGPEQPGLRDFFKHFFGELPKTEMERHSLGSGFVISEEGLILTNNHVVEKATSIKIKLDTGAEYDAKVVGTDSLTDLALIQVKPDEGFPKPLTLGDSDAIEVGDWVMAVGNPFGLGQTVTQGILSARGRIIGAGPYDDFLQTDAAINPGNSGGPLFDMNGKVIGINTAIVAQGQGIGFAIPINMAKALLPQLKTGKVTRGWLGVTIQNISPDLAQALHLKQAKGVLIGGVIADGPAAKAGLKRGDVITGFEGKAVENALDLSRMVAMTPPGTEATVEIIRNGNKETVKVKIGTRPAPGEEAAAVQEKAFLGLSASELTPDLAQQYGYGSDVKGVVVTQVEPGSPASDAGLQEGDLIEEVDHQEIHNMSEFNKAVERANPKQGVLFLIRRGETTFFLVLKSSQ